MNGEDWSKKEEWFDKDILAARLPELDALVAAARNEGRKDAASITAARDFLAGRLAALQQNLPEAEERFGASIDAFRKAHMSSEAATVAIEAAGAMRSAGRVNSALRFAEDAVAAAEMVWWGLPPAERLKTPQIMSEAAEVAIPIACQAHADQKVFDFIQRSKGRRFLEQLWMRFIYALPIASAFKDAHGPAPDFAVALRQLDAAWNAYFAGDVVDQRPDAELRVVEAYASESARRRRFQPTLATTPDCKSCRDSLREGEALLEYFVTVHETFAVLLTSGGLRVVPLGIPAKELRHYTYSGYIAVALPTPNVVGVEELYERMHDAEWQEALGGLQGWKFPLPYDFLRAMYKMLLDPFTSELASIRRLVVCPHWVLHSIPFHALESAAGTQLKDTIAVTYMPSASAWEALRRLVADKVEPESPQVAVFGVERRSGPQPATWLSAKLHEAETTQGPSEFEEEARIVASKYGVTPLIGSAAEKKELLSAFATADLVHISCHTVRDRPEILTDGLLLADGLLSLAEISASPRLAAQPGTGRKPSVIVLSACATGSAKVDGGDRLLGIGHELVARLGCQVICSLWRAHAESTSFLMTRLHEHRKTVRDWAEALRLAQQDTMSATSKPGPNQHQLTFRAPYYWAGFFVLGT